MIANLAPQPLANARSKPLTARSTRGNLQRRVEPLLSEKIEFIANKQFARKQAAAAILSDAPARLTAARTVKPPSGLTPYLASLYEAPLLSADEERHYFRKFNYLKFLAARRQQALAASKPTIAAVRELEGLLSEATQIKQRIVQANLRLVVSIAKRFLDPSTSLSELVSDGNISLIRAVEKFDFARGYKFSTYATYAIRRNYYRSVIGARKLRKRYVTGDDEALRGASSGNEEPQLSETQFAHLQGAIANLMSRLNAREQLILSLRFGLGEDVTPKTLQEIAGFLGVCKERVRQLQYRALEKLQRFAHEEPLGLRELT